MAYASGARGSLLNLTTTFEDAIFSCLDTTVGSTNLHSTTEIDVERFIVQIKLILETKNGFSATFKEPFLPLKWRGYKGD
jgi:hypothetical protein